jgi:hypothetical protein
VSRFPLSCSARFLKIDLFLSLVPLALHFSDTSGASKHSSAAATKDAYTEGINPVFVATTVPGLCGQLKAFKKAVRHKRAKPTDPDGLGLNRPGMNLHFFRTGISPTWEDPYNEKVSFANSFSLLPFLLSNVG